MIVVWTGAADSGWLRGVGVSTQASLGTITYKLKDKRTCPAVIVRMNRNIRGT